MMREFSTLQVMEYEKLFISNAGIIDCLVKKSHSLSVLSNKSGVLIQSNCNKTHMWIFSTVGLNRRGGD